MILQLFRRRAPHADSIARLYGAIVAQARNPVFYQSYGVPDTVNGRFEMLVLHAALLLGRLEGENAEGRRLGQAVFDRFCDDMDSTLREAGVGDMGVPRKMKAIGEAFYGRKRAYEAALAVPGLEEIAAVLTRNVYDRAAGEGAPQLAAYVREIARGLAASDGLALRRGSVEFPAPPEPMLATAVREGTR